MTGTKERQTEAGRGQYGCNTSKRRTRCQMDAHRKMHSTCERLVPTNAVSQYEPSSPRSSSGGQSRCSEAPVGTSRVVPKHAMVPCSAMVADGVRDCNSVNGYTGWRWIIFAGFSSSELIFDQDSTNFVVLGESVDPHVMTVSKISGTTNSS